MQLVASRFRTKKMACRRPRTTVRAAASHPTRDRNRLGTTLGSIAARQIDDLFYVGSPLDDYCAHVARHVCVLALVEHMNNRYTRCLKDREDAADYLHRLAAALVAAAIRDVIEVARLAREALDRPLPVVCPPCDEADELVRRLADHVLHSAVAELNVQGAPMPSDAARFSNILLCRRARNLA